MSAGREVAIGLLDLPNSGRKLADAIGVAELPSKEAATFDDLVAFVERGEVAVVLVAFEALWPATQQNLKRLRSAAPGELRVIVAYPDRQPRLRLGRKLWAIGLIDELVARSSPPGRVGGILRQSLADVALRPAEQLSPALALAHDLSAQLLTQSTVEGLLRKLQLYLTRSLDFQVLQVLTLAGGARLHVFQRCAVDHAVRVGLATRICDTVSPLLRGGLTAEELVFTDSPPLAAAAGSSSGVPRISDETVVTLPLIHCGDVVGGIGLAVESVEALADRVEGLRVAMMQLATSLRYADALHIAESNTLVDELTGAFNRRYMARVLGAEWRRARRYGHPLTLAMLDIDHFGEINEKHGYLAGDAALRRMAARLKQSVRDTDHVIRHGGDELLVILPETGPGETLLVLERLRVSLEREAQTATAPSLTFSAGVAGIPLCRSRFAEELVELARSALETAKRTGHGRICMAHEQGVEAIKGSIARPEKRRAPRIGTKMRVRYLELTDFGGRAFEAVSSDISAGGMAVRGPASGLRRHAYSLLFLEGSERPVLAQVVWTRDIEGTNARNAGLRFIRGDEMAGLIEAADQAPVESRPRALVIASHARTRSMVRRVLSAARYDGEYTDETPSVEVLDDYDVLIVGESALSDEIFEALQSGARRTRLVLVNEAADRRAALEVAHQSRIEHFVGFDSASEEALFATLNKLVLGEYFGLRKYLSWGSEPTAWSVYDSEGKDAVLAGIERLAKEVCCHPRISDLLVSAADEMIINALYHAPGDVDSDRPVTIEAGSDGRFLAVAVLDEFGIFKPQSLFDSISRALEREQRGLTSDAQSAGLGFRIMLTALSQLAINIEPGRRTEIIGIVDLRKSLREYRASVPSFGIFDRDHKERQS